MTICSCNPSQQRYKHLSSAACAPTIFPQTSLIEKGANVQTMEHRLMLPFPHPPYPSSGLRYINNVVVVSISHRKQVTTTAQHLVLLARRNTRKGKRRKWQVLTLTVNFSGSQTVRLSD
ncbi:Rpn5p [Anopheles sinensis]|uniref:Rpn5p n=1 Tax=Anopheles sinensis TaxID=74873 RepID=A0A084WMX5_ANOSI|nr:Rpn5p [Anopheles sinensis]